MTIESKKLIFDTFLKSHKAYKAYYANLMEDSAMLLAQGYPSMVEAAFFWSDTKQGHEYWHRIHTEWRAFVTAVSETL